MSVLHHKYKSIEHYVNTVTYQYVVDKLFVQFQLYVFLHQFTSVLYIALYHQ